MNNKTVVILLSDKRSGSTMFQRELCKHPQVQTVAYSPHTYLETHHWLKGAVILAMAPATFGGGKVYPGYGSSGNARSYLIDCIQHNVPGFQIPKNDHDLVFQGWDALCNQFARPVFFEKSPQLLAHWAGLSLLLEWMKQTEFMVKIIGLIRNPLSVQYSAYQLFHTDPEKRQYSWLETQKNLLAFRTILPAENSLLVKYEDIIEHPQDTFGSVCNFIGVEPLPEIGRSVHAESLTKWKDDPFFTLQLDGSVRQIAASFGYPDNELENLEKPDPPLSYRLKRKWMKIYRLSIAHLTDRIIKPIFIWVRSKTYKG